jgi:hypothetical protein
LVALDCLPFNTLARSEDIRKGLAAQRYMPPASDNGIRGCVAKYTVEIKENVLTALEEEKKSGIRFSVTLDEYTSARNRRYCCVNIHNPQGKFHSIGMIRVQGSLPAERAVEMLCTKLEEFHLDLKCDIIAVTTDGASVMKKMGRILECEHQLCHAHGLHLAVCDVLYKKTRPRGDGGGRRGRGF